MNCNLAKKQTLPPKRVYFTNLMLIMLKDHKTNPRRERLVAMKNKVQGYDGNLKFIQILRENKYLHKLKQPIKNNISFLDQVNFGESEANVIKILGEPFFVYKDQLSNLPHTVFSYGLKSGSSKLKVELHFIENSFFLGVIYYRTSHFNHYELNHHFKVAFGLDVFHFKRDIIVDPSDNFIEFHLEPNHLIMTYSRLKWINLTNLFKEVN